MGGINEHYITFNHKKKILDKTNMDMTNDKDKCNVCITNY